MANAHEAADQKVPGHKGKSPLELMREAAAAAATSAPAAPAVTPAAEPEAHAAPEPTPEPVVVEAVHAVETEITEWFDTGKVQKRGQVFDGVLAIAKPNFVKVWVRFKEALTDAEKAIVAAGGKRLDALIEVKGDKAEVDYGKTAPEA